MIKRVILFSAITFLILTYGIGFILYRTANSWLSPTNNKLDYFVALLKNSDKNNIFKDKTNLNILVLGLDERNDQLEKTKVTDTIIFSNINLNQGRINLISLPRDLWIDKSKTKINQFYPLSLKEPDKFSFLKQQFSNITGYPIDKVLVIRTEDLIKIIDLIGGVDVNLEKGFKDEQYPNPEYIKNPSSNTPIYITVEFSSGLNHLDASNVTQFVRSRHGGDTPETGGTDLARVKRQQLLIEAVISKIKSGAIINQWKQFPLFYNYFHSLEQDFTDQELSDLIFKLLPNISNLKLNKINLPVGINSKDGLIYHPNYLVAKQWVFLPSDSTFKQIQEYLQKQFQ